jgi:hypothetical protein
LLACGQGPPKEGKTERCGSDITFFEVLGVGLNALLLDHVLLTQHSNNRLNDFMFDPDQMLS